MGKLCKLKVDIITEALQGGNTRRTAAAYAGISPRTLQRWLKRGREEDEGEYVDLLRHVEMAEADATVCMVAAVMKAAQSGEWRAAAWWLERRYPDDWGRRPRTVVADEENRLVNFVVQIGGDADGKHAVSATNATHDDLD